MAIDEGSVDFAIKLIKASRKLGVTKLKFGTLEFELDHEKPRASGPALKASKKEIAAQEEKNQLQFNMNEAKDDLSTMHVEDPSGFERAIVEGELDGGDIIEETYSL